MSYNYCATSRGVEEHIRDAEDCTICKEWIKAGKPVTTAKSIAVKSASPTTDEKSKRKPKPAPKPRSLEIVHGTTSGYHKHRNRGETPCQPCKDANSKYARELNARKPKRPRGPKKPREYVEIVHGTVAGASLHRYRGEPTCEPCQKAMNAYARERYYKKRGTKPRAPRQLVPCGTETAYRRHLRANETPCDPCKEASRLDSKKRYDKKKGKTA